MSEYEYSDYESSSDESRKRPRLDEEVQRRMNVISQLRGVERDTTERNAQRILQGADMCTICMEKKLDCKRLTSQVPQNEYSLSLDDARKANQVAHISKPVELLKWTRLRVCVELQCGHSFHWGCIFKWIEKSAEDLRQRISNDQPSCPLCRTEISELTKSRIGYVPPVLANNVEEFQDPALFGLDDGFQAYNPADFQGGGRRKRKSPKKKSPKKKSPRRGK